MKRKSPEILDEPGLIVSDLAEVMEILLGVLERAGELRGHLQTGHQHVGAAKGRRTCVQVEGGDAVPAGSPAHIGRIRMVQICHEPRMRAQKNVVQARSSLSCPTG